MFVIFLLYNIIRKHFSYIFFLPFYDAPSLLPHNVDDDELLYNNITNALFKTALQISLYYLLYNILADNDETLNQITIPEFPAA